MPHEGPTTYEEEEIKYRLQKILSDERYQDNPLLEELQFLAQKYFKLSRKLDKIAKISDQFQKQLRELNEAFQRDSLTDYLTALPNRSYIQVRLEAEINRCARYGHTFGLIMADIDRFKQINDRYGHLAGDQALIEIARIIRSDLRKHDICARWGGEEFLILLSEADDTTTFTTAERLRQKIASQTIHYESHCFSVTLSLGACTYKPEYSIDECIRRADQALYRAKRKRNRSVMYGC